MKKISLSILLMISSILSFGQTTIKMEKQDGVFVVPCIVNDLKLKFIFDTGASDVSISLTEALFMVKNGYLKSEDILGRQYFKDATGDISVGTKIILRKIEFGSCVINNVEATVVNEMAAPLLLGQSAMAKLGKFQFEPNSGTLVLIDIPNANNTVEEKYGSLQTLDLKNGFRKYKFGSDRSSFRNLKFLSNGWADITSIFMITDENMIVGNYVADEIIYRFYKNKFCSVTINLKGTNNCTGILNYFEKIYGGRGPNLNKIGGETFEWAGNIATMTYYKWGDSAILEISNNALIERYAKEEQESGK